MHTVRQKVMLESHAEHSASHCYGDDVCSLWSSGAPTGSVPL